MMLADAFFRFDDELARAAQQPVCSPFWRAEVKRFLDAYEAGAALEWWGCVGRGGAKSTTIYKLAMFLTLHADFEIPPAETHFAIVLSRNKTEAAKGLVIISRWLAALEIEHDATGEVIRIEALRRGIRVLSASVAGASGWRAFFVAADEFAKWAREGEALMLDADEVLASAKATTATHPNAPTIVMSTPWTKSGSFFESITSPPAGVVVTPSTPSWIANPVIIEASTRAKERNESKWRREYNAEFTDAFEGGFFNEVHLLAAIDKSRDGGTSTLGDPSRRYIVAIDAAFTHDAFTCSVAHVEGDRVVVDLSVGWSPKNGELSPTAIVGQVVGIRRSFGGDSVVYADQFHFASLRDIFRTRNTTLADAQWQTQSKLEKYNLVQRLLADGLISLPDNPVLLRELRGVGIKRAGSGTETITYKGSDDYASSVIIAIVKCHEQAHYLSASPRDLAPEWIGRPRFDGINMGGRGGRWS